MRTTKAVVLGGGGLAGIAWELGLLVGLGDEGVRITAPDLVVGTSAGSVVGTVLAAELPLDGLFDAQVSPGEDDAELGVELDLMKMATVLGEALSGAADPVQARKRIGAAALAAQTVPEETRRTIIEARLPIKEWPERRLLITTIEAETGEFVVFDKDSGVSLTDAVAASCAVPIVWPTVTINGTKYMDGGMRSTTNADIAAGNDRVLIIAPYPPVESIMGTSLDSELVDVRAKGQVLVITPDEVAAAGFGMNPLDTSTRRPAALAGRDQGRKIAAQVKDFWAD